MNTILYLLIIIIPILAQIKVTTSYNKYKRESNSTSLSGFEVARKILDANGLDDIYVVETAGNLTDHYDPSRKVIKLSKDIFKGESIAAAAVAAHECGHALQDKEGYTFMRIRSFLVPVVNLVSTFSWIVIFIGILTEALNIFTIGIGLISVGLIFQLITLPVEFNASRRAKEELQKLNLIGSDEDEKISNMLGAAAMTYVASVLASLLQIIRLISIFNDNK